MPKAITIHLQGEDDRFDAHADQVRAFALENGMSQKVAFKITLTLDELVTNALEHGQIPDGEHDVKVSLHFTDSEVVITYSDNGKAFNPLDAPPPELDLPIGERQQQVGGMGIHIIKHCMDQVEYSRIKGRNTLTLTKAFPLDDCKGSCTHEYHTE